MIRWNRDWLESLGITGLPPVLAVDLLSRAYADLERRTGERIAETLSEAELEEFKWLLDAGDEDAAQAWLDDHIPNRTEIVQGVADEIAGELVQRRDEIMALAHDAAEPE